MKPDWQLFQDNVVELAHACGYTCALFRPALTKKGWRTPVGADGKGYPDITLVNPRQRRVIWAEIKTGGGKPTPEQQWWLDLLTEAGCEAYCWRPDKDIDEIARILRVPQTDRAIVEKAGEGR